jgi:hypothetical protein
MRRQVRLPKAHTQARTGFRRDRLAALLALATVVCLGSAFVLFRDTQFLMPGPLASAHGAIENCGACHTKSGSGKLSWIHGLVAGDPLADSKACLSCHKMPATAFNAHGASIEALKQMTKALTNFAAETPAPLWARTQSIAFPIHDEMARGLYCATCHQEHQGVGFSLNKISNEKCGSCHVVKFDSFDGHHPKFEKYPFKRRTRIVYDHAGHFGKHFPEVAKKYPARRIPATCSDCHNSHEDKRVMAVAPFDQTCATCHLDQIIGKERASGPKGIAFLTLPGLDLKVLKEKSAPIGEWPDASDAELTPFMKAMIGRDERGRALIKAVGGLNLQDLTDASDEQIKAVITLVWEIKRLFYALISRKASDVLADLNIGGGKKLSADVLVDLTASLPRDVIISAQQQWLPNLAAEMNSPGGARDQSQSGWNTAITAAASATEDESGSDGDEAVAGSNPDAEVDETASIPKLDPPVCTVRIFGQCLLSKAREERTDAAKAKAAEPEGAAGDASADSETATEADGGKETLSADEQPQAAKPEGGVPAADTPNTESGSGAGEQPPTAKPEGVAAEPDATNAEADGGEETPSVDVKPQEKTADQTDDLLFPTEDERRAMNDAERAAKSEGAGGDDNLADLNTESAEPLVQGIESDVDPESWAEYGGWYRQDYAIYYRPTGHKDKFVYSWLTLTGPQAPRGDTSPAALVFEFLTGKDAQGSCAKCHSVDDAEGKGQVVNFSPLSVESKQGNFTSFIHEPHFQAVGIGQRIGILENRGCLTCHDLEKSTLYLKSYERGNPQNFVSNFGEVKKDLCQTCHNASTARQDCLLCHKYHVNGVITPIMSTKIPAQ